ncbi:MAG: hypothetical protein ABW157_04595 [Candidatus Thiodiazotropha sp. LLP2]
MIRWIAFFLAAIVLALAAMAAYLGGADLGRHKDQLTPLVSNALGRELRVAAPRLVADRKSAVFETGAD